MDLINKKVYKILYVDDEKDSLNAFKNLFSRKFNIITASSSQEALKKLKANLIHVIIVDQNMPDMTGVEFLKKVNSKWPELRCILLTAFDNYKVIKEAINEAGIFWYLNKPFAPDQMEQILINASNAYHTDNKLNKSEKNLRLIYNTTKDVLFQLQVEPNDRFRFLSINLAFLTTTGLSEEQVVGKTTKEVMPEPTHTLVLEKYKEAIRTKKTIKWEETTEYLAGVKIGNVSVSPVFDSDGNCTQLIGSVHDITKMKESQVNLEESEAKYRSLVDNAVIGIFHTKTNGQIIFVNEALAQMYDYDDPGQMMGGEALLHWVDQKKREQFILTLQEYGSVSNFDAETISHTGRHIHILMSAKLEADNILGMVMDITKRKKAELQILDYQKRLKDLTHELTLTEENVRKQIALDLHDDVGQLLSSVRMQMLSITEMEENPELIIRLNNISQLLLNAIQATRAAIFDLSPPQLHEIGLYGAVQDWMIEQIEQKHSIKTEIYGNSEKFNLEENTRLLLFRSIRELGMNVVKHAKAKQLTVAIKRKDRMLAITVQDDGVGFNYNPNQLKRKSDMYGLFSIHERISDLGGTIEVDSEIDKGTSVKLLLPI